MIGNTARRARCEEAPVIGAVVADPLTGTIAVDLGLNDDWGDDDWRHAGTIELTPGETARLVARLLACLSEASPAEHMLCVDATLQRRNGHCTPTRHGVG